MSKKVEKKNVGRIYRQQVLSGYEHIIQPQDTDGNSPSNEQRREEKVKPSFWQQKSYQVSFSVIIEKVGDSGDQHNYRIHLNGDSDISLSPISIRSKKVSQSPYTIHQPQAKKGIKIPLVYGIHKSGVRSLSYPDGYSIPEGIAHVYSFLLGQLDRAIECTLQQQENQAGNDDSGQRAKGTQSPENLGEHQAEGWSEKVLPEIRNETVPEKDTMVDGTPWKILGNRLANGQDKLGGVGNDTGKRKRRKGLPMDARPSNQEI